ncbi:putative protein N(5)-glutamine methyltransferase [Paenibacillus thiaminolyticus]|uniref:putative protein N(5)-glutamine methyltransferase n=1 Tax=Paenibacillus thiaminolyticus TaxID=49283 RepID=UPI0026D2193B|nr:putative protein N(5)-glutamine methyltransferase [Paenibacillus thiaminolyticus]
MRHNCLSQRHEPKILTDMVERRVAGFPLEHIIGWADFCGTRIAVESGVFVPRRRTEFLIQQAAYLAMRGAIIVDLYCCTGAVCAALATVLGGIDLYAVDIDSASVKCACHNLNWVNGNVYEVVLYHPLPTKLRGCVHILVANAPYVPTEAIKLLPREAREYGARLALDGGAEGLDVQRRVAAEALLWLAPGGHLLVETSHQQALQTVEIFAQNGLIPQVKNCDELDATVVIGTNHLFRVNTDS